MFYDKKQALRACEEDPSLIFRIIKEGYFDVVDEIITKNKIDINLCDNYGNDIMMNLLKAKQYDLVFKFMRKRSWNINHQNLEGNTFGHILAKDNSVKALKIVEQFTKNKRCILNIKNNKGETVLDRSINSKYIYTALKIIEDKRFNNISVSSFKRLYNACINNNYYGKYSRVNNLEIIIDSLGKKDLIPSMRQLLDEIKDNIDVIKNEIMKNKSLFLENIINTSLMNNNL